jgi:hypothetical protein
MHTSYEKFSNETSGESRLDFHPHHISTVKWSRIFDKILLGINNYLLQVLMLLIAHAWDNTTSV